MWMFLLWLGSTLAQFALRPRPKQAPAPKPSGIGEFTLPTAEEGRVVQALFGLCRVRGANLLFRGDLEANSIKIEVDSGLFGPKHAWEGFRYFMGMQLGLCAGPIDEVVQILFDDKPLLNSARIIVTASDNAIVFGNSPSGAPSGGTGHGWYTAFIPVGAYADATALANAAETAMVAALSGTWKLVFGFHLITDRSDELVYSVKVSGVAHDVTVKIPGVYADGYGLATAATRAFNQAEILREPDPTKRVRFTWMYDTPTLTGGQHFRLAYSASFFGFEGVYLRGVVDYSKSALPHFGFQMGFDYFAGILGGPFVSDFVPRSGAYMFAYAGIAGKLGLSDATLFTAWRHFGAAIGSDQTIGQYVGGDAHVVPSFANYTDGTDFATIVINAPTLYGGDPPQGEGGVAGTMIVYKGTRTQVADPYLQAVIGRLLPGYRSLCYAVLRHMYLGNTTSLKAIAWDLRANPNELGLTGGHENIGGDANPACILYRVLTDPYFGLRTDPSRIDVTAFRAAGDALYTEGLGLSLMQDTPTQGRDFKELIERHIDGIVYDDPYTGKITLILVRGGYDLGTIPVVSPDNARNLSVSYPSWESTQNVVKVRYIDRAAGFVERFAIAIDEAAVEARGGVRSVAEFDMTGISNATQAEKAAARLLPAVGRVAAIEFDADRTLWQLRPGSPFLLNWPAYGISGMPCRVGRDQLGEPRDGKIHVIATQDVHDVTWTTLSAPGASGDNPNIQALIAGRLEETPYALAGGAHRRITTLGVPNTFGATLGYHVWSDPAGGAAFTDTQDVLVPTPSGLLSAAISPTADAFTLTAGVLLDQLSSVASTEFAAGYNLVLVDDEWIAWQFVTNNGDGTFTISGLARGVMDTTPRAHGSSSRAWFTSAGSGTAQTADYSADSTVSAKLLAYNSLATFSLSDAALVLCTLASRYSLPYLPTAIKLNTVAYPGVITGNLVVSWSHRNRLGTWAYNNSGATGSPETSTTYRIKVYGDGGTLKHTESGLTGTSWTYAGATENAENGGGPNSTLRVVLETVIGGLVSRQAYDWTVTR